MKMLNHLSNTNPNPSVNSLPYITFFLLYLLAKSSTNSSKLSCLTNSDSMARSDSEFRWFWHTNPEFILNASEFGK